MAERFGYRTIKDAIVTLFNNNTSDLNNGLTTSVKQIITRKPDNIAVKITNFPTVCVWLDSVDEEFRGASTRKMSTAHFQIHFWVHDKYSIDASIDDSQLLADNISYILRDNVSVLNLSSTRGYMSIPTTTFVYNTDDSGFISHGLINLDVIRFLN